MNWRFWKRKETPCNTAKDLVFAMPLVEPPCWCCGDVYRLTVRRFVGANRRIVIGVLTEDEALAGAGRMARFVDRRQRHQVMMPLNINFENDPTIFNWLGENTQGRWNIELGEDHDGDCFSFEHEADAVAFKLTFA